MLFVGMDITKEQRQAFLAVCKYGSVTKAASELNITQAALSIRIKRLEDILSSSLFIRKRTGLDLTEAAHRFMEYATTLEHWEKSWWDEYRASDKGLTGDINIGAYSTIGRSLVLPALAPLLKKNTELNFKYFIKELSELPQLLMSGQVDLVFLDRPLMRDRVESHLLGHEEYVFVKSKKYDDNETVFLNHDEADEMSFRWIEYTGKKNTLKKRRFLDEIYSVIDGVAEGVGVSVLPRHLVESDRRIQILHKTLRLRVPVYLIHHKKSYYPNSFIQTKDALAKYFQAALK